MSELLEEQRQRVQKLTTITDHTKEALSTAYSRAKEEELKALHLEVELQNQVSIFHQTQKSMTAKLADEDAQNQQLRQKLVALGHQFDKMEGKRNVLKNAEEELWELRSRMRHVEAGGERRSGTQSLLSEVEILRRRVLEMEGKDEELIRMGDQCQDLDQRLVREISYCHSLKEEVDKLNGRINELDRIEDALGKSKQECSVLRNSLERERDVSKVLSTDLDTLKVRVRELEASESQLERREATIRQDLSKLRTLTVALVEDRKTMAERLRQAEETLSEQENKQNEQSNPATMTERLREESQQAPHLEERMMSVAKEKGELQARLKTEEERNEDLQCKIAMMKKRLQVLERKEKEERRENDKQICSSFSNSAHHYQTEDNKVKELTQEMERLQRRLREKEVLGEELMKVEEAYKLLERRFKDEQKRHQALTEELEEARRDVSKYQQAEKQDVNQEHHLLCRLQQEQVKSRLLRREIEALKDKFQKLVGTDESICRVQMNHSTLQSKLTQQEARNRELAREMEELVSELDRYRQISKSHRQSANERHFSDMKSTKEVQTEPEDNFTSDYSTQTPLLHQRKLDEENDMDPNHNNEVINRSNSSPFSNLNSLNSANNNVSQYSSQSANSNDAHQTLNGEVMMLTHTPGQPLHIKVTPDHTLNTATLEISSPTGDAATSYTSTAVVPKSGALPKQRITIIHNAALSSIKTKTSPSSPDGANSPLNESAIMRALSPNPSCSMAPEHGNSPIQIVTVSSCSPEPTEVAGQAAFYKTPDWQNRWHHSKSHSTNTSPSIITTEENKIHIHLGSTYIQSMDGAAHGGPQPVGPYYLQQEQITQVVTNGCHVKGVGKITSSITITPATSPSD
ncbi:filamin A-interacting protein 1-like [Genypterus blacodes]|uniref:filamin A-interacting protein 1-like n=1 Tax=Genypterus blacodes TaxID=154954 RepID=UPI003F75D7CE